MSICSTWMVSPDIEPVTLAVTGFFSLGFLERSALFFRASAAFAFPFASSFTALPSASTRAKLEVEAVGAHSAADFFSVAQVRSTSVPDHVSARPRTLKVPASAITRISLYMHLSIGLVDRGLASQPGRLMRSMHSWTRIRALPSYGE